MSNISIKNLNLRVKEDFYGSHYIYKREIRDIQDIAVEHYKKLGYEVFGDSSLFTKAIISFFWEDLYEDEPSTMNIGLCINDIQRGINLNPILDLYTLDDDVVESKIEKAKKNGFRDKLYKILHDISVDFYSENSPLVKEYLETDPDNLFEDKLFKFYSNIPHEIYVRYFDYYEEDYDDDLINEYMKVNKAFFSLFDNVQSINLDYLDKFDVDCDKDILEDYQFFLEFVFKNCAKDATFSLLDDDFDYYLEYKFSFVKRIFDSFTDDELLIIFKRALEAPFNFYAFPRVFTFKDDEFYLIYLISDDVEPGDDYDTLWQYFFLNDLGKNVEFLTFNYSKNKQTRFLNDFKQHKNNLKIVYEDSKGKSISEKFKLENDKELISKWSLIEDICNNHNVSSIILNKKEVEFETLNTVYKCVLEHFENSYNYDNCFIFQEGYVFKTCCKCLNNIMPEIDSERYYFDKNDFCYLNKNDIVIFNKKAISDYYKKSLQHMILCPFFKKSHVHSFIKSLPKHFDYKNNIHWNFVCENNHKWFRFKKKWFNEEGSFDFPGIEKMVAVEKTNENIRKHAKLCAFPKEEEKINNDGFSFCSNRLF